MPVTRGLLAVQDGELLDPEPALLVEVTPTLEVLLGQTCATPDSWTSTQVSAASGRSSHADRMRRWTPG